MSELMVPIKQKDDGVYGVGYNKGIDDCMPVIEQLQSENDALVARVARLEQAINNVDDRNYENWLLHLNDVFSESPQQSLAAIQADAVEEFVSWYKENHGIATGQVMFASKKYIETLRQQGKEKQ